MNALVVVHGFRLVRLGDPHDRRFKVGLTIHLALQVLAAEFIGDASRLAEVSLRVRHPRAGINGIAHLLFGVDKPARFQNRTGVVTV